jgi:hypothetical protein
VLHGCLGYSQIEIGALSTLIDRGALLQMFKNMVVSFICYAMTHDYTAKQ